MKKKSYFHKKIYALMLVVAVFFATLQLGYEPVYAKEASEAPSTDELLHVVSNVVRWKEQSCGAKEGALLSFSGLAHEAGDGAADWYAIAISRCGDYVTQTSKSKEEYLKATLNYIEELCNDKERFSKTTPTELQRLALTFSALGGNLEETAFLKDAAVNCDNLGNQGVNDYIWALLVLNSEGKPCVQESIILGILSYQLENGAFSLNRKIPDVDLTAMALQAFAPYYKLSLSEGDADTELFSEINKAVESALAYLSECQEPAGDFSTWGACNSESTSQVLSALCALDIDVTKDTRFIKNGNTVIDGLLKYYCPQNDNGDGRGFAHTISEDGAPSLPNSIASVQALNAITSLLRYRGGLNSFYDFSDVAKVNTDALADVDMDNSGDADTNSAPISSKTLSRVVKVVSVVLLLLLILLLLVRIIRRKRGRDY